MKAKKICLLGSFAVGKTSLVARFVSSIFSGEYHTTVGVKVDKKVVQLPDDEVKLMIWDLAGKDEFFTPPASYLRGTAGYLLVIDGTREATFKVGQELRDMVKTSVGDVPCLILVNKVDLKDDWEITDEHIAELGQDGTRVLLTSAKTGEFVEEAFQELAQAMLN